MISNRIIHGDCVEVLKGLPAGCADFVLTDPPYGVRYRDRTGRSIANDGELEPVLASFPELYRALKPGSVCVCFYGWNRIGEFFAAWTQAGFRPVGHIVWHKSYASSAPPVLPFTPSLRLAAWRMSRLFAVRIML